MSSRRSARLSAQAATAAMPPPPAPSRKPSTAPQGRKRKAAAAVEAAEAVPTSEVTQQPPADPVTPPPKRRTQRAAVPPPPSTPTPSAVGLIAEHLNGTPTPVTPDGDGVGDGDGNGTPSANSKSKRKPRTAAVTRLADPNSTNAQLLSPETSQVVFSSGAAAGPSDPSASPSKAPPRLAPSSSLVGLDNHTAPTTTDNILERACAHLVSVDPRMKPLVDNNHCRVFSPEGLAEKIDPFESLCSGIISQQVSGAAAKSIKAKFVALFDAEGEEEIKSPPSPSPSSSAAADGTKPENGPGPGRGADTGARSSESRFPHPSQVAATKLDRLRTAGLSQRKAEYIQGIAAKFASGDLSARMLAEAPYDEVLSKLIAVRGLGQWSVEMFACFALKRLDVFSLGDLGVQRGMAAFVGRDVTKLKAKGGKWKYMSEREMVEISDRFAPYRSLFMWYMWRVEETDVSTME